MMTPSVHSTVTFPQRASHDYRHQSHHLFGSRSAIVDQVLPWSFGHEAACFLGHRRLSDSRQYVVMFEPGATWTLQRLHACRFQCRRRRASGVADITNYNRVFRIRIRFNSSCFLAALENPLEERSSLLSKLLFARYRGRRKGNIKEGAKAALNFFSLPSSRSSSPAPSKQNIFALIKAKIKYSNKSWNRKSDFNLLKQFVHIHNCN